MKHLNQILFVGSLAMLSIPALAGHKDGETAKVVSAVPVYEVDRRPVDKEVCWEEQVWHRDRKAHSPAAGIFGAIVGGVIGHQFGGGSGKTALTIAGAAIGSSVANNISHKKKPVAYYPAVQDQCEVQREWRTVERIIAWDVTYQYHGELYETRMRERPGDRIRVSVNVEPLGN